MSYIIEACLSCDLAVFTKSRKWSLGFYAKPLSYISQVKFLSNSPGKFCFFLSFQGQATTEVLKIQQKYVYN